MPTATVALRAETTTVASSGGGRVQRLDRVGDDTLTLFPTAVLAALDLAIEGAEDGDPVPTGQAFCPVPCREPTDDQHLDVDHPGLAETSRRPAWHRNVERTSVGRFGLRTEFGFLCQLAGDAYDVHATSMQVALRSGRARRATSGRSAAIP